jgi:hypothetical protein
MFAATTNDANFTFSWKYAGAWGSKIQTK